MAERLLYNPLSHLPTLAFQVMFMAMAVALPPYDHRLIDDDDNNNNEGYIEMDLSSANATFEFKMCYKGAERELFSCPADELFYKGKLLPLLLLPRLRTVENLLDGSSRLESPVQTTPATLSHKKKAFSEKFKLKLKASQSYLKALFTRDPHKAVLEEELAHRRSFSGATIARNSTAKSPSSCSSFSSSSSFSCSSSQIVLKSSSSASSEMENSILGAIAYCKESQLQANTRMRSMAIACEPQERPRPCDNSTK